MVEKKLFLEAGYLEKSKIFYELKNNFIKWKEHLGSCKEISLEESQALIKLYGVTIPRILIPYQQLSFRLYRARILNKHSVEDITDPKTFSYPPKEHTKVFQRANAPGFPVFYGALDGKTAFEELRFNGSEPVKKGDTVFLSEWSIKPDSIYSLCYLTNPEISEEEQLFSPITKNIFNQMPRIFSGQEPVFSMTQQFLYKEASKLFLTGKHIQSGIIAHEILYNTPEVNGITIGGLVYPSCSNNYRSVNCALHPDFVDKHLELETVRKLSFESFRDEGAQSTLHYFSDIIDNKIVWQTFVSELMINDHSVEIGLEEEWSNEEVVASKLSIHGEDVDLHKYCWDIVNKINLNDVKIPFEKAEIFKKEKGYYCIYDLTFDPGIAWLTNNGKINPATLLRIKTPVKAYVEKADLKAVLS
jgi:hypothetical protein